MVGDNYLLRFDGACSPNPGAGGIGWVLYNNERIVKMQSKAIGFATNNIAEYSALIDGLQYCINNNIALSAIEGDSLLVINQVNDLWKCKDMRLLELKILASNLLTEFSECELRHIRRENNTMADACSRAVIK